MKGRLVLSVMFALAACGSDANKTDVVSAPEPDRMELFQDVLAQHQAINSRVERVAHRLLTVNADRCAETVRATGMSVHTLRDYPRELRPMARHFLGVDEGISVRSVVPDGPAWDAGVEAGDAIRRVGTMPVERSVVADRIWRIAEGRELQEEDVALGLVREGKRVAADVETVEACDVEVGVAFSEELNAFTDGERVVITSELVRRTASDSRLALILAHELAHVIAHVGPGTERSFDRGPEAEIEADALGLELLNRAGFDATEAVDEMESFARQLTQGTSGTHPLHEERVARLRAAIDALR